MPDGRTEHDRITDLAIQVEHYAHATNTELRAMRQGQERLEGRMDRLEQGQEQLRVEVNELKADVKELKIDVAQLKTDVKELKADVSDLREGQKQMQDTMNENFRQLFVILNSRQG